MHVLIVDASASDLSARAALVRQLGVEVVTVSSAEAVPAGLVPHAILVRARGARGSVARTIEALRRQPNLTSVPLIATGESLGHAVTALSAGADDYWSEPLDEQNLPALIGALQASRLPTGDVDSRPLVLVADDDRFFRERTSDALREWGCTVETFSSGAELLWRLEHGPRPALMVLDAYMPGVGGQELLTRLGQNPNWSAIPVVVMSGVAEAAAIRSDFMRLGARAFVAKSGDDLAHLREVVQSSTSSGAARQRQRTPSFGLAQFRRRAEDPWFTAFVWNLGPSGVFLRTTVPAPRNALVQLRIDIPGGDERLVTIARVAWSKGVARLGGQYGMGLQFHQLADEAQRALDDLVGLHQTRASPLVVPVAAMGSIPTQATPRA